MTEPLPDHELDHLRFLVDADGVLTNAQSKMLLAEVQRLTEVNDRMARRVIADNADLNAQLGPVIQQQKAAAWDEGLAAGSDQYEDGFPMDSNPYRVQETR